MMERGQFRKDLFFRLNVIPIHIPPLRERSEDIPFLVQHFIEEYNRDFKKNVKGVHPTLMQRLMNCCWHGNIRELRNSIERAMILGTGEYLSADNMPLYFADELEKTESDAVAIKLTPAGVNLESLEKSLMVQALKLARGNQTRAGHLLGLSLDQVRYRIEKFGLQIPADEAPT